MRSLHPRRLWEPLKHQVGRRGYFLLTLAVVDFAYGWMIVFPDTPAQRAQNVWLAEVIPGLDTGPSLWVWAIGWWVTGAFCLVNAFRKDDRLGYGVAFSLKVAWTAANAVAGFGGMPGSATRCLVWGFFASCVLVIAKWPEPRNSLPEIVREIEQSGEIPRVGRADGDVEV